MAAVAVCNPNPSRGVIALRREGLRAGSRGAAALVRGLEGDAHAADGEDARLARALQAQFDAELAVDVAFASIPCDQLGVEAYRERRRSSRAGAGVAMLEGTGGVVQGPTAGSPNGQLRQREVSRTRVVQVSSGGGAPRHVHELFEAAPLAHWPPPGWNGATVAGTVHQQQVLGPGSKGTGSKGPGSKGPGSKGPGSKGLRLFRPSPSDVKKSAAGAGGAAKAETRGNAGAWRGSAGDTNEGRARTAAATQVGPALTLLSIKEHEESLEPEPGGASPEGSSSASSSGSSPASVLPRCSLGAPSVLPRAYEFAGGASPETGSGRAEEEDECEHDVLETNLRTRGLRQVHMAGDGNCQFRAIADQLWGDPSKHRVARDAVVRQLKSGKTKYASYIAERYPEYLKHMKQDGAWGDHVTLQAAADWYCVRITLITSRKENSVVEVSPSPGGQPAEPKCDIKLSYYDGQHFNSVKSTRPMALAPAQRQPEKRASHWLLAR